MPSCLDGHLSTYRGRWLLSLIIYWHSKYSRNWLPFQEQLPLAQIFSTVLISVWRRTGTDWYRELHYTLSSSDCSVFLILQTTDVVWNAQCRVGLETLVMTSKNQNVNCWNPCFTTLSFNLTSRSMQVVLATTGLMKLAVWRLEGQWKIAATLSQEARLRSLQKLLEKVLAALLGFFWWALAVASSLDCLCTILHQCYIRGRKGGWRTPEMTDFPKALKKSLYVLRALTVGVSELRWYGAFARFFS